MNKKYNTYKLDGEYGIGYTTKGDEFYFDLEDYDKIKDICWCIKNEGYVYGWVDKDIKRVSMHSWIRDGEKGVDHINRKPNDNRRCNLRSATAAENSRNTLIRSRDFTGVYWNSNKKRWIARVQIDGRRIERCFKEPFLWEAQKARLLLEKEYFKEFAPQRHLFEEYGID